MAAIAELMRRNIPSIIHSATDAILGRCAPGEVLCKMIRDIQLSSHLTGGGHSPNGSRNTPHRPQPRSPKLTGAAGSRSAGGKPHLPTGRLPVNNAGTRAENTR